MWELEVLTYTRHDLTIKQLNAMLLQQPCRSTATITTVLNKSATKALQEPGVSGEGASAQLQTEHYFSLLSFRCWANKAIDEFRCAGDVQFQRLTLT